MDQETFHPQSTVYNPLLGKDIKVDESMVPILTWLWDKKIRTENSCEGINIQTSKSLGYISFKAKHLIKDMGGIESFKNSVMKYWSHYGVKLSLNHNGQIQIVILYRQPGLITLDKWFLLIKEFFSQDSSQSPNGGINENME